MFYGDPTPAATPSRRAAATSGPSVATSASAPSATRRGAVICMD